MSASVPSAASPMSASPRPSAAAATAAVRRVVSDAVPPGFRLEDDSWSHAPLRLLALGHVFAEALSALSVPLAATGAGATAGAAAAAAAAAAGAGVSAGAGAGASVASVAAVALPWALRPCLTGASLIFIACAAWDRSRRAAQFQLAPAARAYMGKRAALESLAREWVAVITLPSLAAAGLLAGARAALAARGRGAGAAGARAARWAPAALVLTLSPALLAGAAPLADAMVMDWAVRPALDAIMPPPGAAAVGALQVPEDLLAPPAAALPPPDDAAMLLGLAPPDALTRAQLEWALDGRKESRFPSPPPAAAPPAAPLR